MSYISLSAVAKRCDDGSFDAEVMIAVYQDTIAISGYQGVVETGLHSREAAMEVAESWILKNLFPIVEKLPKAKP